MSERARSWLVVVAVAVLVVGGAIYLRTSGERRPPKAAGPLASPTVAAGTVGGLLPDVTLDARSGAVPARQLRPAVLMLTRPECDCVRVVRQVVGDATPAGVATYVVMAGAHRGEAEALAAQAGGVAGGMGDAGGELARTYNLRTDAALVLVRDDGVVTQVVAGVGPTLDLRALLRGLG